MSAASAERVSAALVGLACTTEAGRDALGYYHEKKSEERNVGLGPDHDWSSHAADAFGLMCVVYEEPSQPRRARSEHRGSWMAG